MFEFLALVIVTLVNRFRLDALLSPTLFLVKLKNSLYFLPFVTFQPFSEIRFPSYLATFCTALLVSLESKTLIVAESYFIDQATNSKTYPQLIAIRLAD